MSIKSVIGIILIIIAIMFATAIISKGAALGWMYFWVEPTGRAEAEVEVQSSDFRLQAYHEFYDLLVSINSDEEMYDEQHGILQTVEVGTKDYLRIQQNMAAYAQSIIQQKLEYNARAGQWTRGQFLDNNLPARLSAASHKYGNRTGGI